MSVFVLHNNMHAVFSFESQTLNCRLYHFVLCDGWTNCFLFSLIHYSAKFQSNSQFKSNTYDQTGTLANRNKCTQLNSTSQNSLQQPQQQLAIQSQGFYNLEEVEKLKTVFDEDLLKIVMAMCLKIGITSSTLAKTFAYSRKL